MDLNSGLKLLKKYLKILNTNFKNVLFLPNNYFMSLLQTQAFYSEHHVLQCSWQRVGEDDLCCHLLANDGVSQRLQIQEEEKGEIHSILDQDE